MSIDVAYRRSAGEACGLEAEADADGPAQVSTVSLRDLQPLLEGARARGIADAYELMGQAAVLLDGDGGVLHLGAQARALLGGGLVLRGGHLVGTSQATSRMIADLVASALEGRDPGQGGHAPAPDGRQIAVRVVPFPPGRGTGDQLLKAVILLDAIP